MTKPDERAFPLASKMGINIGLTKREWFAGLAMQGVLASGNVGNGTSSADVVHDALVMADALIAELAKEDPAR